MTTNVSFAIYFTEDETKCLVKGLREVTHTVRYIFLLL